MTAHTASSDGGFRFGRRPAVRPGSALTSVLRETEEPGRARPGLLLVVQLSSERTLEPVRRDSSFATKQESPFALLVVVHSRSRPSPGESAEFTR
jgi:hypothetical protein